MADLYRTHYATIDHCATIDHYSTATGMAMLHAALCQETYWGVGSRHMYTFSTPISILYVLPSVIFWPSFPLAANQRRRNSRSNSPPVCGQVSPFSPTKQLAYVASRQLHERTECPFLSLNKGTMLSTAFCYINDPAHPFLLSIIRSSHQPTNNILNASH